MASTNKHNSCSDAAYICKTKAIPDNIKYQKELIITLIQLCFLYPFRTADADYLLSSQEKWKKFPFNLNRIV